jgi:hypothetical protein
MKQISEQDIPEELLSKILSFCLAIPPQDFFRFPQLTLQADPLTIGERNAQLLLVSKRWWRVGTPALYNSLKLSTVVHANCVAKLLSIHPELGHVILNLRFEGNSVCPSLHNIIKLAPNIHSVYISVDRKIDERVDCLRDCLSGMDPKDVFLMDITQVMKVLLPWSQKSPTNGGAYIVEDAVVNNWQNLVSRMFHLSPVSGTYPPLLCEETDRARPLLSCHAFNGFSASTDMHYWIAHSRQTLCY